MVEGHREEAPLDPETTDSAHDPTRGLSLLQIRTFRIMSWDNFERLPPPGNPSKEVFGSPSIPLPGRSPEGNSSSSTHKQATQEVFVSDEEVEKEEGSKGAFQQSIMLKPDRMNFVKLMQRWNNNPLRLKIPDNIDARPVALQFLAQSFAGWDDDIRQLHIYTDGSYHPGMEIASFSFVIFGWNDEAAEEQKSSFVGWYSDVVTTDQMDPNFTGAQHQSSMEGGTSALMWSHIWLLQSGCQLPVVFHYDSQTSGHGAAGIFHIGSNNLQLKKLRQVVHLIQVIRTGPTDYEHVKAHSGSPGNELADSMAKWRISQGRCREEAPEWQPLFRSDSDTLEWAWWIYSSMANHPGHPTLRGQECIWSANQVVRGMEGVSHIEEASNDAKGYVELYFTVGTYNAMTLRDCPTESGQKGVDWTAALLREQFNSKQIHVIGIQETRGGQSGIIITSDYVRCVSAGSQGHHGCEIWFSRTRCLGRAKDSQVYFDNNKLTVLYSDTRMMFVHARPLGVSLIFCVAHAPHDGTEDNVKQEWWDALTRRTQKYSKMGRLICLGDFNARLGRTVPDCVGDRTSEDTTDNGERLVQWMEVSKLWAPTTYSEVHQGHDWTWTHPRGCKARLDYIILAQQEDLWALRSYVDTELQTSLTVRDHELAVADLGAFASTMTCPSRRRNYDWNSMRTEEGRCRLREIIDGLPEPEWSVDVHQHWQILEDAIHDGLQTYFPAPRPMRRIDMFSSSTRSLLDKRKAAKKILDLCDDHHHHLATEASFRAWRDDVGLALTATLQWWPNATLALAKAWCLKVFRTTAAQLRQSIKQDKANYIDEVIGTANSTRGSDIYQALKPLRIGGAFRKKGMAPLPGMQDGNQELGDEKTTDDVWLRHCAKMEAGVFTTTGRLLQRARRDSQQRASEIGSWNITDIPTLSQLEGSFRRVKRSKAGGNDDLKSDICRLAAGPLAKKYHSLLVKMHTMAAEPIQMKGGTLIAAHKGGDRSDPGSFRSLLLSSHIGKSIRRTFRQQLIPWYQSTASETHFSIKVGGNVSQASHALRLFLSTSAAQRCSAGVLFLDIKSAYYRVVRQLVTSRSSDMESITRMMHYFDIGSTDPQALLQKIAERVNEQEEELDRQREILLEEMLSSTWFTSKRRKDLVESLAGTRPGDGLADIVFGMVFHKITKKITSRLQELLDIQPHDIKGAFNLTKEPDDGSRSRDFPEMMDVVWADDLALCLRRKSAEELPEAMQTLTQVVFQECLDHGLTPNLRPGKSEVLLMIKGPGCRKVKAAVFNSKEPTLKVDNVPEEFAEVRLVSVYKHLGTRVQVGLRHMAEIRARFGQASTTYRKYRRQIFQNKLLSLQRRVQLFKSLVMSVLEYNIGTWGCLTKGEVNYMRKRLYGYYRGLARATIGEDTLRTWNTDRVLAYVQLPDITTLLHGARLRYSLSVYSSGPRTLWDLIWAERQWHSLLREAYEWFNQQLVGYGPDRHGHKWEADIHEWSISGAASLRKWLRRAEQHDILQKVKHTEWREWHHEMLQQFISGGYNVTYPWAMSPMQDRDGAEACLRCRRLFSSMAARSVHGFRAHGITNKARRLVGGTRCDACQKEYHHPASLQNHLNNSERCYRRLIFAGKIYDILQPGKNSTREAPKPQFGIPPLPSEGPKEQRLLEADDGLQDRLEVDLMNDILDELLQLPSTATVDDCIDIIKTALHTSTHSLKSLREMLWACAGCMEQEEEFDLGWRVGRATVLESIRSSAGRCYATWFFDSEDFVQLPEDIEIRDAALNYCREQKEVARWTNTSYIPRFGSPTLAFLHVFSGHRRQGDIQYHLEREPAPPGTVVVVLSVDVIYDHRAGDLADPPTRRHG